MAENISETVDELLSAATTELDDLDAEADDEPLTDLDDDRRQSLESLAERAEELIETSEPDAFLGAIGFDAEDGPESIPEAILTGDADRVHALRTLLALSRLVPDEADDSGIDDGALETLSTLVDARSEIGSGPGESGESEEVEDEAPEADAAEDDGDDTSEGDSETVEDDDAGIASMLRSAFDDAVADLDAPFETDDVGRFDRDGSGVFDDDGVIAGVSEAVGVGDGSSDDGITGLVSEAVGSDDESNGAEGDGSNGTEGAESNEADGDESNGESEDDGLLDTGDGDGLVGGDEKTSVGSDESRAERTSVSGYGRSGHSTMPAQDRADMSGVERYSTMPDR
ncbi:hypothetical protein [Halovivax gelatinilyticus]|uniref:hypothetical protein n=1 Tax=Halovivax gelatinilyticus TaxID=2961597 RepID=UPI0020CA2B0F|nr:hypothetical protein [Halovivax gelatinilyticus]